MFSRAQWFTNPERLFGGRESGVAGTAHLEAGGFIRTRSGAAARAAGADPRAYAHPDLQFHFLPGLLTGQLTPGARHGWQVHCSTMRATSRGTIALDPAAVDAATGRPDPRAPPLIDPNYLATQQDVDDLRHGLRLAREICEQPALAPYRGAAVSPAWAGGAGGELTDAELDAWARAHAHSAYHPSGACKMGPAADAAAVVDPATLQVHGVEGLRVVDSSIMPTVVSGNLNAPTVMLAEKAADAILGKPALRDAPAPDVWVADGWARTQRSFTGHAGAWDWRASEGAAQGRGADAGAGEALRDRELARAQKYAAAQQQQAAAGGARRRDPEEKKAGFGKLLPFL